jgi:hypothetical protein
MRNKIIVAAMLTALALSALGFNYQADKWKWEYKAVTAPAGGDEYDTSALNGVGASGWELVSVERNGRDRTYFFKRAK